jgi:hypothetical protein
MSIEFRATAKLEAVKAASFIEAVTKAKAWTVSERQGNKLTLRWKGEAGPGHREDVSLELEEGSVYVAVSSGTRPQRDALLAHLAQFLSQLGINTEFEEL